jgi:hypothetical protein
MCYSTKTPNNSVEMTPPSIRFSVFRAPVPGGRGSPRVFVAPQQRADESGCGQAMGVTLWMPDARLWGPNDYASIQI